MKAKQVGNKLILTWENEDDIKVGETITIELENKPSEECIECKKNNGKWCDKHREEAIIEACSPRKTNTDQYTEDMPSTQYPHPLTSKDKKIDKNWKLCEAEEGCRKKARYVFTDNALKETTHLCEDHFTSGMRAWLEPNPIIEHLMHEGII